ncbi:MAG TPA: ribonuclease P protein component [Phycisphaerae bacterium]|nr:ribonuclease P protein component [Phycisphaerales bacterium]HRX87088.1 ribonuclease P protein component [Phycisphaerae bacterium]
MAKRLGFSKRQRIHQRGDFARLLRRRCSAGDGVLVVYVDAGAADWPRLAVRASKRLGGAVVRNRARRRLKEAFRLRQHELPVLDILCQLRSADASVEAFGASLERLVRAAQRRLERAQARDAAIPRSRPDSR